MHNTVFLNEWSVKRAQPITAIQHLTKERKQKTQKTPKNEKTTKQLLGEFYSDKKYLENLLKDKGTVLFHLDHTIFSKFCLLFMFHTLLSLFLCISHSPADLVHSSFKG